MRTDKQFKALTEDIQDLPTLPSVVLKLNSMIRSPRTSAQQVGNLISNDPALTAKALKLVNSAFYGFPRKITNITHAIVILGFQKVRDIVLAASMFDLFRGKRTVGFHQGEFWEHTLVTALAAETLAKELGSPEAPDAFVSGLLHDIGKLILAIHGSKEYEAVRKLSKEQDTPSYNAETLLLGFNHSDIGSWLGEKWQFPEKIVGSIRLHHAPEAAREYRELNNIIHVADILARAIDLSPNREKIPVISNDVWNEFRMNERMLDNVYVKIGEGIDKAKDFFALIPKE
jgi:putative nucleotidyltransferase with HDIG domain